MATSQLGNHYKSKCEGDIKGLNELRWREGRERWEVEDKEVKRGEGNSRVVVKVWEGGG